VVSQQERIIRSHSELSKEIVLPFLSPLMGEDWVGVVMEENEIKQLATVSGKRGTGKTTMEE